LKWQGCLWHDFESQSSEFLWRKPEQYQSQHQNSETKPEKHFRQQQEPLIGKDALQQQYSPTP
jgi:hypothetical protein